MHVTYYYDQLNKNQQRAYYAIKEGLESIEEGFQVPMLTPKEIAEIYAMVRMDNPMLFYSVSYSYRFFPDSNAVEMFPKYLFKKEKIVEHRNAMKSRVNKLARAALNLNEKEKLIYIHDFLVGNVKYDKLKKEYSHEIIGALGNGVAVCEGISKAVKVLCDELNIWCTIAISENNPDKGIKYRHAWNIVRIDNKFYNVDVTFDNSLSKDGVIRYDYFMLSDKQIERDHENVVWEVPKCSDNDHFFYKEKKVSWTTYEEVRKRAQQAVKKNKLLLFHWRGGYLTKDVLDELVSIISGEAKKKEKQAQIALNWPQAVLQVRFEDKLTGNQIEMQEANEGEIDAV